jgi:hypothetical protein
VVASKRAVPLRIECQIYLIAQSTVEMVEISNRMRMQKIRYKVYEGSMKDLGSLSN